MFVNLLTSIFIVILLYITFGFVISVFLHRNDIADVMWGPGIFLVVLTSYVKTPLDTHYTFPLLVLVFFWAMRIFLHIGIRFWNKAEEDFRYKIWRETWKYFYLRSYFQIYLLQGFFMILVGSSLAFAFHMTSTVQSNIFISFFYNLGIIISIFGLTFETLADLQLTKFINLKKSGLEKTMGNILKTGVWKYTRHPNYFGEVTFWWGIFIALLPVFSPILLISPLTITYLILFVSGIPILEKKYEGDKEFEDYKKVTPAFFPKFF